MSAKATGPALVWPARRRKVISTGEPGSIRPTPGTCRAARGSNK